MLVSEQLLYRVADKSFSLLIHIVIGIELADFNANKAFFDQITCMLQKLSARMPFGTGTETPGASSGSMASISGMVNTRTVR